MGSHSLLEGIFPTQGLSPGLLYCRQIFYCLSHQGSYSIYYCIIYFLSECRLSVDCELKYFYCPVCNRPSHSEQHSLTAGGCLGPQGQSITRMSKYIRFPASSLLSTISKPLPPPPPTPSPLFPIPFLFWFSPLSVLGAKGEPVFYVLQDIFNRGHCPNTSPNPKTS